MPLQFNVPPAQFAAEITTLIALRVKSTGSADVQARAARAMQFAAAFTAISTGDATTAVADFQQAVLTPSSDPGIALLEAQFAQLGASVLQVELNVINAEPVINEEVKGYAAEAAAGITAIASAYLPAPAPTPAAKDHVITPPA
jgi:hypothetical protein